MLSLVAPPGLAPDRLVFRLRRAIAHALGEEFSGLGKRPSLWSRGYVVECGTSIEPETIREYLTEQEERKS
jgi:REP element-mobilizing transposase RayT